MRKSSIITIIAAIIAVILILLTQPGLNIASPIKILLLALGSIGLCYIVSASVKMEKEKERITGLYNNVCALSQTLAESSKAMMID